LAYVERLGVTPLGQIIDIEIAGGREASRRDNFASLEVICTHQSHELLAVGRAPLQSATCDGLADTPLESEAISGSSTGNAMSRKKARVENMYTNTSRVSICLD
jgi:hypothetical protein